MMVKPSVTELLKKTDNRYELVIATSKRARQIVDERMKEKNEKKGEKEATTVNRDKDKVKEESAVTVAAEEIADGRVKVVKNEEEEETNNE